MKEIDLSNWNYTSYTCSNLKAFISMGAEYQESDNNKDCPIIYQVSLLEDEKISILEKDFKDLKEACHFINKNYGHWDFSSLEASKSGGCSTCVAH